MPLISSIAYLMLLGLVGYAALSLFLGCEKRPLAEVFALSGMLGCTMVPLILFWLSLAGARLGRTVLLGVFIASLFGLYPIWRKRGLVVPTWRMPRLTKVDWLLAPSLVLIVWSLITVTQLALKYPLIEWDGVSTWGFKAKILALASGPELHDYFHDFSLNFSHLDYPLLTPFLTAGLYGAIGEVDDTLGKAGILFLFWCYAIFVYVAARTHLPRYMAAAVTALAVSAPLVLRWAGQGTADMPLAIFYAGSIYYLVRWILGGTIGDAWLAGIFSVACLFTKNEGLPLAVINLFAATVFGWKNLPRARYARELGAVVIGCGVCALPWILFRHSLPHIDENYPGHLNLSVIASNRDRVPWLLNQFFLWMFRQPDSNFVWQLAAGALVIGLCTRPSPAALIMLFLLLAHLSVYLLAYTITPLPLDYLVFVTWKRLLLHTFPAGVFILMFSLSKIVPNPASASQSPISAE